MAKRGCPLCTTIKTSEYPFSTKLIAAIPDAYPVSPGHSLVLPRRHHSDVFCLTTEEKAALWRIVRRVQLMLLRCDRPAVGFNVGVNMGTAAGQTIAHGHVHVIPRYKGDVPDPRGGVRWVIPEKAAYWEPKGEREGGEDGAGE